MYGGCWQVFYPRSFHPHQTAFTNVGGASEKRNTFTKLYGPDISKGTVGVVNSTNNVFLQSLLFYCSLIMYAQSYDGANCFCSFFICQMWVLVVKTARKRLLVWPTSAKPELKLSKSYLQYQTDCWNSIFCGNNISNFQSFMGILC